MSVMVTLHWGRATSDEGTAIAEEAQMVAVPRVGDWLRHGEDRSGKVVSVEWRRVAGGFTTGVYQPHVWVKP